MGQSRRVVTSSSALPTATLTAASTRRPAPNPRESHKAREPPSTLSRYVTPTGSPASLRLPAGAYRITASGPTAPRAAYGAAVFSSTPTPGQRPHHAPELGAPGRLVHRQSRPRRRLGNRGRGPPRKSSRLAPAGCRGQRRLPDRRLDRLAHLAPRAAQADTAHQGVSTGRPEPDLAPDARPARAR